MGYRQVPFANRFAEPLMNPILISVTLTSMPVLVLQTSHKLVLWLRQISE